MSLEELLDMEVTSVSRRPQRRFDTASAVHVVSAEDIHRSSATRIPEALRLAPNLHVAQIDTGLWAISARGFNNGLANKMLVLIDGRTVYTPMFGGVFWDVQDTLMESIDRIEIVSGPGGTAWGANAVNGVISVNSKRAADTQGMYASAGAGSELESFGALRYGGRVGENTHYRVYAKYTDRDSTRLLSGAQWTDHARYARGGLRADWESSASDSDLITIQGEFYEGDSGAVSSRNSIDAKGAHFLARWEHSTTPDTDLKVQLYFDQTRRSSTGQFTDELDTYDVDVQHRFPTARRHEIIWGFGYRQIEDLFRSTAGQAFLPPRLSHRLFNAFAQDRISLADDRAHLMLGAKLEHNDYTGWEWQPNVRLAFALDDRQMTWGAVSRAIRSPARFDRDLFIPNQPPFAVVGGPEFHSEILLAYEAGYRIQPHPRTSFDVAAFYNDYEEIRSVEQVNPPATLPLEIRNRLEGYSYGAELSSEFRPIDRWRLTLAYRYLNVNLHAESGSTDLTSVNAEAHDPEHIAILRSSVDVGKQLQIDATFRYVGRIDTHAVPQYEELDLRLAWQPSRSVEFAVVGQNLLRDHHAEFRPVRTRHLIERSVFGRITFGW